MYKKHPNFKIDRARDIPLWRYMDFWKFLDLINTQKLFFPNFEHLGDQHEGRIPDRIYQMMIEKETRKGNPKNAENYKNMIEKLRKTHFVSSWISAPTESFAMWKMYAKDKLGIAIKTNLVNLRESFNITARDIYIGEVTYYDDDNPYYETGNTFYTFLAKHNYYTFEKEVRCILETSSEPATVNAHHVDVDLKALISDIYISPFANKKGLVEIIEFLKQKAGLNFKIRISGINDTWL